jgi:hypothetical protein
MTVIFTSYFWQHAVTRSRIFAQAHWDIILGIAIAAGPWLVRYSTGTLFARNISDWVLIGFSIVGIGMFIRALLRRERPHVVDKSLPRINLTKFPYAHWSEEILHYREYRPNSRDFRRRQAIYSKRLNELLWTERATYEVLTPPWRLAPNLTKYQDIIIKSQRGTIKFDGRTVKQESDLDDATCAGLRPVRIREAHYVGGLATNDFCEHRLESGHFASPTVLVDGHNFLFDNNGFVRNLTESSHLSANQLGFLRWRFSIKSGLFHS